MNTPSSPRTPAPLPGILAWSAAGGALALALASLVRHTEAVLALLGRHP